MTLFEIAITVLETFEGEWYVREKTDYWRIKLNWPFFGLDYVPFPLPGEEGSDFEKPIEFIPAVPVPLVKIQ